MKYNVAEGTEVLRTTPGVLRAMLADLSKPWIMSNYGKDTFSPFDVVGHMIHGERTDWVPRAKIILEHGDTRPFDKFDRYAMYEASKGKSIGDLLDEFASLRAANLGIFEAMKITQEQFELRGVHPALGEVTLGNLLSMWVVHDLNHIGQIAKAMAFQYGDEVGPWVAHLSILPR